MKRKFLVSLSVLLALTLAVLLVPAVRIRVFGLLRREMFFGGLPYSRWVDRLGTAASRGSAEQDIRAAGATAVPLLVKMLQEPNPDLRWEAARLLADIAPAIGDNADLAARALLAAMYDKDRDQQLDNDLTGPSPAVEMPPEQVSLAKRNAVACQAAEKALVKLGPAAIPALVDGLKSPNRLMRSDAARLLGGLGTVASGAGPALAEALAKEPEEAAQGPEAQALDKIGTAPALLAAAAGGVLDHAALRVRTWAAKTLAGLEPALLKPELPAILRALSQPLDIDTALQLDRAMQRLGPDAIPGLVFLATGEDPVSRAQATPVLQSMGPPAVAALAGALNDPSAKVRGRAAHALCGIGAPAAPAIGALMKLAGDPNPGLRARAIGALAAIDPGAASTVQAVSAGLNDPDGSVRLEAAKALAALPAKTDGTAAAVARAVKQSDPRVRAAGIAAMASIEVAPESAAGESALAELLPILGDAVRGRGVEPARIPGTRAACQVDAIHVIAALGQRGLPDLPVVLEALKDPDKAVAAAAAAALPELDPGGARSAAFLADLLKNAPYHWVAIDALLTVGATKQAFSAVADDIRSSDPATAGHAIEWVYQERPPDRDAMLFDEVVPALIARLGDDALSRQAGNVLEQLSSFPELVPAIARGLNGSDPKAARGAAGVLEDIALYDQQSAAAPAAAEELRDALQNGKETGDPELQKILEGAVRRLGGG